MYSTLGSLIYSFVIILVNVSVPNAELMTITPVASSARKIDCFSMEKLNLYLDYGLRMEGAFRLRYCGNLKPIVKESDYQNKVLIKMYVIQIIHLWNPNTHMQPHEHTKLSQVELLVVEEAAAIPLPVAKSLLGPYLVFLSSTANGHEVYILSLYSHIFFNSRSHNVSASFL